MDGWMNELMNEWMKLVNKNTILKFYWMDHIVSREEKQKKNGLLLHISMAAHPKNECNPGFKCQLFSPTEGIKKARGI